MLNAGAIAGSLGTSLVSLRTDAKKVAVASGILAGASLFAISAKPENPVALVALVAATGAFAISAQNHLNALVSNAFPAETRSSALGFTLGFGRARGGVRAYVRRGDPPGGARGARRAQLLRAGLPRGCLPWRRTPGGPSRGACRRCGAMRGPGAARRSEEGGSMMAYSESTEDYLEAILRLGEGLPVVRQVDVAGFMGFSKASVCKAVPRLAREGLVECGRAWRARPDAVGGGRWQRGSTKGTGFFSGLLERLGVDEETAQADACRMEHALSEESFAALRRMVEGAGSSGSFARIPTRSCYTFLMTSYTTIAGRAVAEIEEKKSRFIASLAHVETEEEALAFLEEVRAANRMARHNVYAYVLREGGAGATGRVRYSDDGEPQKTAGLPTLEVLQHAGLTDVAAVVTRYFGGVLLGTGGLVRAYTQATQAGVEAAELVVVSRCVDLEVRTSYARYEQLTRIAADCGAKVLDTGFADEVTLRLRMLDGTQAPLLAKLTELERGQERCARERSCGCGVLSRMPVPARHCVVRCGVRRCSVRRGRVWRGNRLSHCVARRSMRRGAARARKWPDFGHETAFWHGSAPLGMRPKIATWSFAGDVFCGAPKNPPFCARTRFGGQKSARSRARSRMRGGTQRHAAHRTTTREASPDALRGIAALVRAAISPIIGSMARNRQLILDRYRPIAEAGTGGFGTVQVAWDTRIQRKVAIKCIGLDEVDATRVASGDPSDAADPFDARGSTWKADPDDLDPPTFSDDDETALFDQMGRSVSMFSDDPSARSLARVPGLDEARTAALLSDANIVTVYDFEVQGSTAYLIMEYVDGITLSELLERFDDRLSLNVVAAVFAAVSHALEVAHDNQVLHLDIKPDNVLINRQGQVKVTDFGLAVLAGTSGFGSAGRRHHRIHAARADAAGKPRRALRRMGARLGDLRDAGGREPLSRSRPRAGRGGHRGRRARAAVFVLGGARSGGRRRDLLRARPRPRGALRQRRGIRRGDGALLGRPEARRSRAGRHRGLCRRGRGRRRAGPCSARAAPAAARARHAMASTGRCAGVRRVGLGVRRVRGVGEHSAGKRIGQPAVLGAVGA